MTYLNRYIYNEVISLIHNADLNFHTILIQKRTYMLNVNVEIYAKIEYYKIVQLKCN